MQDDIRDPETGKKPRAARYRTAHRARPPITPAQALHGVRILVWVVILLLFGLLFWWVMHHRQAPAARPAAAGEAPPGGTVTLTTATAKKGNIGVYLDAIGTVTPVYTDTIISQVTGMITQVLYREGQLVHRGQPLIQIDPRPFQANVLTAQGQLERDTNLLAQAEMDLKRYQDAWARNAIPKQTLDDQEKIVLQDQGTVKADQGPCSTTRCSWPLPTSPRPSPAASACAWSIPATWPPPPAPRPLAVITQMQPITVVFTIPEDNVTQAATADAPGQAAARRCARSLRTDQAGSGKAAKRPTTRSTPRPAR